MRVLLDAGVGKGELLALPNKTEAGGKVKRGPPSQGRTRAIRKMRFECVAYSELAVFRIPDRFPALQVSNEASQRRPNTGELDRDISFDRQAPRRARPPTGR